MKHQVSTEIAGKTFSIETGQMARQADGAVVVQYGDTVILATAVASKETAEKRGFFPLTVNYMEKSYAAGKIPGGFFKREGRPGEKETLTSRLIDRPIRPLFPDCFYSETQVIAIVLSADQENDPDVLALTGASAALSLSPIPFLGPIAGVRVGENKGEFLINPTYQQLEESSFNIIVAGTADALVMVEGFANEVPDNIIKDAIFFAHNSIIQLVQLQNELLGKVGINKVFPVDETDNSNVDKIKEQIKQLSLDKIKSAIIIPDKLEREKSVKAIKEELAVKLELPEEDALDFSEAFKGIEKEELRRLIIDQGLRADGRGLKDIRKITCDIGLLPRTHGSALFTRGETQALAITTLGTSSDEQRIDDLEGESTKNFMLHYNFPPFSVGETSFMRGPGRREIGHGNLAERAIKAVLPDSEKFPYTIRIVSDILESNGSSSMASVCGASLSLMDAGVPVKASVAGIAMGLIMEGDTPYILNDILGLEDHLGDMDFKVAGTNAGITAIQMDIKIKGINETVVEEVLERARLGRLEILKIMEETINTPRESLAPYAPRIVVTQVKSDKVRDVIGPGGKNIKFIIEQTGAKIDVEDSGRILIATADEEAAQKALALIEDFTGEVEVNKIYTGKVKKVLDFGAFVEVLPGTDGLLHISEIADYRVNNIHDEVKEGDVLTVKVIEVDRQGRIRLSKKAVTQEQESYTD